MKGRRQSIISGPLGSIHKHFSLFTECLDLDIAKNLDLAGQAQVGIFLERFPQANLLQHGWRIYVAGRRHDHAVGGAETIAMAVRQLPEAAVEGDIILQRRVTHMIALRHFNL